MEKNIGMGVTSDINDITVTIFAKPDQQVIETITYEYKQGDTQNMQQVAADIASLVCWIEEWRHTVSGCAPGICIPAVPEFEPYISAAINNAGRRLQRRPPMPA